MKRLVASIIILCFGAVHMVTANQTETVATSAVPNLNLTAESAVVMEAGTGTLIYEKEKPDGIHETGHSRFHEGRTSGYGSCVPEYL